MEHLKKLGLYTQKTCSRNYSLNWDGGLRRGEFGPCALHNRLKTDSSSKVRPVDLKKDDLVIVLLIEMEDLEGENLHCTIIELDWFFV